MNISTSRIDGVIEDPAIRAQSLKDHLSQTVRVGQFGDIERGVKVPHEAANIPCGAYLGLAQSQWGDGIEYMRYCKKRVGHRPLKGEKKHKPVDYRMVASPYRVVHTERFKPNTMPAGLDMTITLPHDCANHLPDVAAMEKEAYRRGK